MVVAISYALGAEDEHGKKYQVERLRATLFDQVDETVQQVLKEGRVFAAGL